MGKKHGGNPVNAVFGKKMGGQINRFGKKASKTVRRVAGGVASGAGSVAGIAHAASKMGGTVGTVARAVEGVARGVQTGGRAISTARGNSRQVAEHLIGAGQKAVAQGRSGMPPKRK
jgi:hypothetical protein